MGVRLLAMTCGWLTGPTAGFLEGEDGQLRVPVPVFLVDHPRGAVLFDSGLHPDAGTDPSGRLGPAARVFLVELAPGEDVAGRLGALGVYRMVSPSSTRRAASISARWTRKVEEGKNSLPPQWSKCRCELTT